MTPKECAACKVAEADARIAELEQAVADEKAGTQAVVKDVAKQLRYERRLTGIIQATTVAPFDAALVMLLDANKTDLFAKGK